MTTATETLIEPDLSVGDDLPVLHIWDGLSRIPKCGAPPTHDHLECRGAGTAYRGQEACLFCGRPICEACQRIWAGWTRGR